MAHNFPLKMTIVRIQRTQLYKNVQISKSSVINRDHRKQSAYGKL